MGTLLEIEDWIGWLTFDAWLESLLWIECWICRWTLDAWLKSLLQSNIEFVDAHFMCDLSKFCRSSAWFDKEHQICRLGSLLQMKCWNTSYVRFEQLVVDRRFFFIFLKDNELFLMLLRFSIGWPLILHFFKVLL